MRSNTLKAHRLTILIIPNKEEITFNMTFHKSLVVTRKTMRKIFWSYGLPFFKHLSDGS